MDLRELIHSPQAASIQLVVSAQDLAKLLDDAMAFAMKTMKEREEPDYYTRQELADKLHISLPTLQRWRDRGRLPEPVTIDGRVLYDKAKVRDVINGNRKIRIKLNNKNIQL